MNDWKKWVIVVAGVVSLLGQFWGQNYYLPALGGIVAAVVGLML